MLLAVPGDDGRLGRSLSMVRVLNVTLLVLAAGFVLKDVCGTGEAGRPGSFYCYSDIRALYFARGLIAGRFPYFGTPFEYPVGIGVVAGVTAAVAPTARIYFLLNVVALGAAGMATAAMLYRLTGVRVLFFSLAPSLLLWGFLNWDLLAVVLATVATATFLRRENVKTGTLLGLGAATKAYPILLLVPFALQRLQAGARRGAAALTGACIGSLVLLNLPFALLAFGNWSEFFRLSSTRPADYGSVWSAMCEASGGWACLDTRVVNALSLAAFLGGCIAVYRAKTIRDSGWPRWTFGFAMIALFLIVNKVFSPQYSMWLLPWFALVLPDIRLFVAFEVIDIGIFVTHFGWQNRLAGLGGLPLWPLNLVGVLRAGIILATLIAFVRRPTPAQPGLEAIGRVPAPTE